MKSFLPTVLCATALAPCQAMAAPLDLGPEGVQLELRREVIASRHDVQLGDLAIVRTRDLAAMRQLVALPVGNAPRAGAETVVRREVLARWVRGQIGLARSRTLWTGAQETLVHGAPPPVAGTGILPVPAAQAQASTANPTTDVAPGVARGDWVILQLRSGALELERRTQALQDGHVGDTVKVRGENGPVAARILAPGRVEAAL